MSHSQFHCILFIPRHAWLNLWDKHMTTGRINQITIRGLSHPLLDWAFSLHINIQTFSITRLNSLANVTYSRRRPFAVIAAPARVGCFLQLLATDCSFSRPTVCLLPASSSAATFPRSAAAARLWTCRLSRLPASTACYRLLSRPLG